MLSTGAIAAPSACLRCQLRQIIFRTGRRVSTCRSNSSRVQSIRSFSASCPPRQDGAAEGADVRAGDDQKPRLSEYPLGRIFGKPGRRHRETSARLSQDSMQRPFEVVVLRDVPNAKNTRANRGDRADKRETNTVDASQIARDVLGKGRSSNVAELFKSIDALQPETTLVNNEEYKNLAQRLLDGYSMRQLSRYLSQSLRSASESRGGPGKKLAKLAKHTNAILAWQPQSSPSNHVQNMAGPRGTDDVVNPKSQLVEQILRRSWGLSIDAEMHRIGYLDMKLEPWQLSYLFDLYENSKPMHENWIKSPLLLRSSELRPDRVDSVLRVIARKQDAEEIAELIYYKFQDFESLELDLSAFKPAKRGSGRSKSPDGLPNDHMLQAIQRRLFCIFERKDHTTMAIHAPLEVTLWHARRAFLSLLNLPSPSSIESMTIPKTTAIEEHANTVFLPEWLAQGMKTHGSTAQYERLVSPSGLARPGSSRQSSSNMQPAREITSLHNAHATEVADRLSHLNQHNLAAMYSAFNRPFWDHASGLQSEQWQVQICKILYPDSKISSAHQQRGTKVDSMPPIHRSAIQAQIPRIPDLLQLCSPTSPTIQAPLIVAHFLPNPFTRHGLSPLAKLPRMKMTYSLTTDNERPDMSVANLSSVHAIFEEQELRLQLSQEATDLRFVRQITLPGMMDAAVADGEIQKFTAMLQHSLNRKRSFLDGEPEVKFTLPSSPFEELTEQWAKDLQWNNYELEYLFERFEQVRSVDLRFNPDAHLSGNAEPLLKDILGEMPSNMYLRYQEIEGGVVGGRRTELKLIHSAGAESSTDSTGTAAMARLNLGTEDQAQLEQMHFRLADMGLRLAKAVTEINARGPIENQARAAIQSGT